MIATLDYVPNTTNVGHTNTGLGVHNTDYQIHLEMFHTNALALSFKSFILLHKNLYLKVWFKKNYLVSSLCHSPQVATQPSLQTTQLDNTRPKAKRKDLLTELLVFPY